MQDDAMQLNLAIHAEDLIRLLLTQGFMMTMTIVRLYGSGKHNYFRG